MRKSFKDKMNDRSYEEHLMKNYIKRRETAEQRANTYSYFLAAVCVIIAVLFIVYGSVLLGLIFAALGGLMVLLVYLSKKQEEKENQKKKDKSSKNDK